MTVQIVFRRCSQALTLPCHENEVEKSFRINDPSIFIPGGASRPTGVQGVSPASGRGF